MLQPMLYYKVVDSPVGPLKLVASERGLCAVLFSGGADGKVQCDGEMQQTDDHPVLKNAQKELAEYFDGRRTRFSLPLDMRGTVFQMKAWRELQKIPYGSTISYGEQARRLGDSKKARAVGMANGRNPLAVVVPCHRVVGSSGDLVGFGGGLRIKQYLLELERKAA